MARIAFIGLGRMGSGMAGCLVAKGHDVAVFNRDATRAQALVARGARACRSPKEACAGAEAIFSMVADDVASRNVWLGADGVLAATMADAAFAVECSTVSHAWAIELAGLSAARGLRAIDAPVTGLPDAAAAGTLTLLVGAEHADLEAARPLLDAVSERILHFGPVGTGTVYKLIVNLIGAIQIASAAEGMALAERAGLDRRLVAEALASGQAASPQVVRSARAIAATAPGREATFTAALRLKDVQYALALYAEMAADSGFGAVAAAHYLRLCELGHAASAESTIIEVFRARKA